MSKTHLKLEAVKISVQGNLLLDLSCQVGAGEVLTIMGPSGSGKSSLLAYIAGFLPPVFDACGAVSINGVDILTLAAEHRRVGLLFQDSLLFPHLSVGGNLRFALDKTVDDKEERIHKGLDEVGLPGFEERDPETLSGGQKARIALLRLLLSAPRAALLDEPFSKLDTHLRQEMRTLVFEKLRATGLPTILVTHDREDAEVAGGEIITLG